MLITHSVRALRWISTFVFPHGIGGMPDRLPDQKVKLIAVRMVSNNPHHMENIVKRPCHFTAGGGGESRNSVKCTQWSRFLEVIGDILKVNMYWGLIIREQRVGKRKKNNTGLY